MYIFFSAEFQEILNSKDQISLIASQFLDVFGYSWT